MSSILVLLLVVNLKVDSKYTCIYCCSSLQAYIINNLINMFMTWPAAISVVFITVSSVVQE